MRLLKASRLAEVPVSVATLLSCRATVIKNDMGDQRSADHCLGEIPNILVSALCSSLLRGPCTHLEGSQL